MSEPFAGLYAEAYDALYGDKDYAAECDLIERLFATHEAGVATVLDLGCGTGNHAIALAARGYRVTGVDRAADMLAAAAAKTGNAVAFHVGDIREVDLGRRFDAVLMMFAVLGYQIADRDVLAALACARRHLSAGGLLIFDVWYGPAVLRRRPARRVKEAARDGRRFVRTATSELDVARNLCTVRYRIRDESAGGRRHADSVHRMRYFFAPELAQFLQVAGFRDLRLGAFPDFERAPDETTWNVLATAAAAEGPRDDTRDEA